MKTWKIFACWMALGLAACGPLQVGVEPTPSAIPPTSAPATAPPQPTPIPLMTATSPAVAETPASPTAVPSTPAPSPQALQDTPAAGLTPGPTQAPQTIEIDLIALDDNGASGDPVGCGDSVVPVKIQIRHTQSLLKAAYEALLAVKDQYYGESGLYNALYQSDLQVESVNIKDGVAIVNLTGAMMLGGECDNPRVEAQLNHTALQFSTVRDVSVIINGKPLKEALSLK